MGRRRAAWPRRSRREAGRAARGWWSTCRRRWGRESHLPGRPRRSRSSPSRARTWPNVFVSRETEMAGDMGTTLTRVHKVVNSQTRQLKFADDLRTASEHGDATSPTPSADAARIVERFALLLTDAGWPRMPARVFACLLADDSGRARRPASWRPRLGVSPAAVSGAVRYLLQLGLITRDREPGVRSDHYRRRRRRLAGVDGCSSTGRAPALAGRAQRQGIELLGAGSAAGRRLEESRAFFAYLRGEMPRLLERWRAQQAPG